MEGSFFHWLPEDISTHGHQIDMLINVLHVFMVALFVGWGIFFIYCLIRFRARPGHTADATPKHFKLPTYLEIVVALFEVVLLVFISYPIWKSTKSNPPADADSVLIKVVGEQFAWSFIYPGKDGKFGRRSIDLIDTDDNPLGVDRDDPAGKDDIVSVGEMAIPVNKPIKVEISSKDVIHSFSIPVMRVKQDAIPGSIFPMWFEATKTGDFDITCAQLCGVGHTRMRATLSVMDEADYQEWLNELHEEVMEDYGD